MIEFSPRLIFLIVFVAGMSYLLYKDRNKIERTSILFYRRTKNGIDKIDAIQKRFPRFWKAYGWGAAISGVLSMILAAVYIGNQYIKVFQVGSIKESGLSAVLPGLVSESSFQPGVSFIPVEYWLIGIAVLMTVHELSHGIVARSEGFEINSVGWIVLGIFPGAFVEPKGEKMLPGDEEKEQQENEEDEESEEKEDESDSTGLWDQGSLSSRIKVLGAGSFANYLTAIVFMIAAIGLTSAVAQPGNMVYAAQDDEPAAQAGMNNGTLYSFNGEQLNSREQLIELTKDLEPGQNITLNTSEGVFTVETRAKNTTPQGGVPGIYTWDTGPQETEGYIGILFGQRSELTEPFQPYEGFLTWLISMFETIAVLNIGIGLVNMLPIKPLDGGQILGGVIDKYLGEKPSMAFNYVSLAGMILLLGTILLSIATAL